MGDRQDQVSELQVHWTEPALQADRNHREPGLGAERLWGGGASRPGSVNYMSGRGWAGDGLLWAPGEEGPCCMGIGDGLGTQGLSASSEPGAGAVCSAAQGGVKVGSDCHNAAYKQRGPRLAPACVCRCGVLALRAGAYPRALQLREGHRQPPPSSLQAAHPRANWAVNWSRQKGGGASQLHSPSVPGVPHGDAQTQEGPPRAGSCWATTLRHTP